MDYTWQLKGILSWLNKVHSLSRENPIHKVFSAYAIGFRHIDLFFNKKIYKRWVWDGISSFKILANTASLLSWRHRWIGKLNYWLSNWLGMTWTRNWNNTCKILETVLQYTINIYIIVLFFSKYCYFQSIDIFKLLIFSKYSYFQILIFSNYWYFQSILIFKVLSFLKYCYF